ncbi:MAG: hypothetical protein HYR66_07155 [Sphingobacteriales bacterium]|nr:hypothetical protein [Sphingobacteriales bacterium]MBI3718154.1 hypothetical protein [Sphingobacteriales bacterium]
MKSISVLITAGMLALSACAVDSRPVASVQRTKAINKEAMTTFANDFKDATAVSWESEKEFSFAYFILGNEQLVAAYNKDGEHISTSRSIEFSELPLAVSLNLKKRFPNAMRIGSVSEVVFDNYANYYFTIATKKNVFRIKSTADGDMIISERQKILKQQ